MHPFIHPLTAAVDPVWECESDWEIFKAIAKAFSEVCPEILDVKKDVMLTDPGTDSAGEMAQPFEVKDWWKGECDLIPGKTAPTITVIDATIETFIAASPALGPLMGKIGNGGKGLGWNTDDEIALLKALNGEVSDGPTRGWPE